MITIESSAKEKITDLYIDENRPSITGLRIFVQGGGCSGFQYGFTWDYDINEDDFVEDLGNGVKLLIDSMSYQYIDGSTLKYKKEMMSEQFVIDNPNATRTCGCGSSFGV